MDLPTDVRVQDIGELGLIKRLERFCSPHMIGDDAALLSPIADQSLVVTTDVLVDGVHFSDETTSPVDVGWRAAAANLSDLAAMGAAPLGITVGLSLPGTILVAWVEQLYEGLQDCLQTYGTAVVGGDLCQSSVVSVAITAFGQVSPNHVIRRDRAQSGDVIVVTGGHGASRAGLELLLRPDRGEDLSDTSRQRLIQSHQRPLPRLDVLPLLWRSLQPGDGEVSATSFRLAGMDSSDGLANAVLQICQASGVGALLERSRISLPPEFQDWVSAETALDWALYGGEDFELVLCLPVLPAEWLIQQLGPGAAIIGQITTERDVVVTDKTGTFPSQVLTLKQGFQHF